MVAKVTDAERVVGIDRSEPFLRTARAAGAAVVCADVTAPLPTAAPDLIYARLVLAHLPDPERVIAAWTEQLQPHGVLLLDEVDWIRTENPVLDHYEQIVTAMVASRGAQISVGPRICDLSGDRWRQRSNSLRAYPVATADAARMYAMNLATWRHDPFVVATYDAASIDELAAGLTELTTSAATGEIEWGLRQVVYERTAP